jgi:hypothetical protein
MSRDAVVSGISRDSKMGTVIQEAKSDFFICKMVITPAISLGFFETLDKM